ncbi:hypothetical protein Tco_0351158 [Tanacetum coccineum]
MVEEPLKMKKNDRISFDQEEAIRLKEARITREKEEANTILIEEWDDIQAKINDDHQLAEKLQAREQEELADAEKATLFVQILKKTLCRKKSRGKEEQTTNKSSTKKHNVVNTFVYMETELVEGSEVRAEGSEIITQESSLKRVGDELEQEKAKKQKIDDDQEEAKMKKLMEIVPGEEEVAVNVIPLATKPPSIVDWKIMLRDFNREDLETQWKLVKAKHGYTRPEEGYERVLWGDLKTMFEPNVEDMVWRNLQGNKVPIWKLFDSCGVHFVRFQSLHIFMLVEKKYPLTPATLTDMLNRKLQADHLNEMCY